MTAAQDAMNQINELIGNSYSAQLDKLEEYQEANTQAGNDEQERISALVEKKVITEEEGEARKRVAEEKTAKKHEELERKKAQLKRKQAIYDKAISAMNIGLNTAMAIMKLWVDPGGPTALPMMAVVGALGALELATVLATPIPKYAKGTDYHKGGPAIVGDGGRHEVVMFNGDTWLTPDKPTLVDIPAGASVLPDISMLDKELPGLISLPENDRTAAPVVVNNDYSRLERGIRELAGLIRAQTRQQKEDAANARYELFKQRI